MGHKNIHNKFCELLETQWTFDSYPAAPALGIQRRLQCALGRVAVEIEILFYQSDLSCHKTECTETFWNGEFTLQNNLFVAPR